MLCSSRSMTDCSPCQPSSYRHPGLDSGSKRDGFTHFSIPAKGWIWKVQSDAEINSAWQVRDAETSSAWRVAVVCSPCHPELDSGSKRDGLTHFSIPAKGWIWKVQSDAEINSTWQIRDAETSSAWRGAVVCSPCHPGLDSGSKKRVNEPSHSRERGIWKLQLDGEIN